MITVRYGRLAWIEKRDFTDSELFNLRELFTLFPARTTDMGEEPEAICAYEETQDYFGFPRHAIDVALQNRPINKIDDTVVNHPVPFTVLKQPWPEQVPLVTSAVQGLSTVGGAIINAPCGSGKTNMALYAIAQVQQPTLVIVHKSFLMDQWVKRVKEVLGEECGIVQQDVCDYRGRKIVIAMLQTLAARTYDNDFYRYFGMVVADECHRASSRTYNEALRKFPARYKLGASATLKRSDKLECLFYWHIGPVSSKSSVQQLTGKVYQIFLQQSLNMRRYMWGGKINFSRLITDLTYLEARQRLILEQIKAAHGAGRKILVLSDRKEHLKNIFERLTADKVTDCGFYVGGMKKADLQTSAQKAIILGTYAMAQEGLDIPMLDTVVLSTPKSEVEQSVGRILRAAHGKKDPVVIDIVDSTPILANMGKKRARLYTNIEFQVERVEVNQ